MIIKNNKQVRFRLKGTQNIDKIYKGNDLVFEQGFDREDSGNTPLTTSHQTIGKNLKDYKIYGNSLQARLPYEYQEVEYIENTANSYINTGLIGKPGYTVETELSYSRLATGSYQYFAGYSYTGSADRIYFIRLANNSNSLGYTYGSDNTGTTAYTTLNTNTWYKFKSTMKDGLQELYLNNTRLGGTTNGALSYDESNPKYIYMFVSQYVNTTNGFTYAKCKYAKWYDENDNLVRDFIPCYRKSDGVVGMYDMVKGEFYTNSGSGEFTKGTNVNPTPSLDNCVEIYGVGDVYNSSNYIIPVKVGGKNLLPYPYRDFVANGLTFSSQNNKLLITGTPTATFWGNVYTFSLPAGQYTLVENSNLDSISGHSIGINNGSTSLVNTTVAKNRIVNFELTSNSTLTLTFRFTNNIEIPNEELELMIINRNGSTDFMPYVEPVSLNIILNEPLRKIENNVDYIDFENNKEVRNVEKLIITGDENFEGSNNLFRFKISSNQIIPDSTDFTEQLCNYFECKAVTVSGGEIGASVYYSSSLGGTYFRVRPSASYTIDEFKALLQNLNSNGNPLKIYYPKRAQTEETIELPSMPTTKGTTMFEINTSLQPSNMYVKYRGK